jgi:hypothetical protein
MLIFQLNENFTVIYIFNFNRPSGPYRVWADDEGPGIAMTRTLGDLQGHF